MKVTINLKDLATKSIVNRHRDIKGEAEQILKEVDDVFNLGELAMTVEGSPEEIIQMMKESTDQLKVVMPTIDSLIAKGFEFATKNIETKNQKAIDRVKELESSLNEANNKIWQLKRDHQAQLDEANEVIARLENKGPEIQ